MPNSRLTAAIAATQGVYNNENTKNTKAVSGVNIPFNACVVPPKSTVNVLTTLSFAVNPVIRAVEIRQSSKPKGANTGAIKPPN